MKKDLSSLAVECRKLLDFLQKESNYGLKQISLSNVELGEKQNRSERSIKRYIHDLAELGYIRVIRGYDPINKSKTRAIIVNAELCNNRCKQAERPQSVEEVVCSTDEYFAYIQTRADSLKKKIATLNLEQLKGQLNGRALMCVLPHDDYDMPELWNDLYKASRLEGLEYQLTKKETNDRFLLGPAYFLAYQQVEKDCLEFEIEALELACKNYLDDHPMEVLDLTKLPKCEDMIANNHPYYVAAKEQLIQEATYYHQMLNGLEKGFELLPSDDNFKMRTKDGFKPCTLAWGVWSYMQQHDIGVFGAPEFDLPFSQLFDALNSLHVHSASPDAVFNAVETVAQRYLLKSKPGFKGDSLGWPVAILSRLVSFDMRAQKGQIFGLIPSDENGINKPIFPNELEAFLNQNGINTRFSDHLGKISTVFIYIINNNISNYKRNYRSLWHLSPYLYDLSPLVKSSPFSKFFKDIAPAQLMFDFTPLHYDLNQLAGNDAEKYYCIPRRMWLEFIWFELCYSVLVCPSASIFGNLDALEPSGKNLDEWFPSADGYRVHSFMGRMLSMYYEDPMELKQLIQNKLAKRSKSARQFLLNTAVSDAMQIGKEYICDAVFEPKSPYALFDDPSKAKFIKLMISDTKDAFDNIFSRCFGELCGYEGELSADALLDYCPPVFGELNRIRERVTLTEPAFMMLKAYALSMVQAHSTAAWRTSFFDNSPAKYFMALTSREKDQRLWQVISRSFIPQEIDINEL